MSKLFSFTRMPPRIYVDDSTVTAVVYVHVDVLHDSPEGGEDESGRVTAEAMIDLGHGPSAEISVAVAEAIKIANNRADAAVAGYFVRANGEVAQCPTISRPSFSS